MGTSINQKLGTFQSHAAKYILLLSQQRVYYMTFSNSRFRRQPTSYNCLHSMSKYMYGDSGTLYTGSSPAQLSKQPKSRRTYKLFNLVLICRYH